MRQPPSFFSLHRIAASAFVDSPTTMSTTTRPPFRGGYNRGRGRGRGRRNFSDRPSTEVVSGDSHFQSVHDSNASFQRSHEFRSINNFNNNNNNYARNFNYPSNNSGNRGGGYGSRGRSPSYDQSPGTRVQRPKIADFRVWEFAESPPPSQCERFVVLSYNILADYLANSHRNLYFHIPRRFMSWEWRKKRLLFELGLWSPDIMCFQEVDRFFDLEEDLRAREYSGIWKMRTGDPVDGCAIFWRTTSFRLMYEESIEFNKHGMRNNVAQICVLESLIPSQNKNQLASCESSEGPNRVVICNIHVLYNPRRGEIKLGQVRILLERAQAVSKTWDDAPVVLCGDFNCTPMSPLYNFISEQKLDISAVDRDKVSGQASAVIEPPPRHYGPQFREQPTGDIASPTSVPKKDCASLQRKDDKECASENIQTTVNLHKPLTDSLRNVLANSFDKNIEINESTDNLMDSQGGLTNLTNDETRLANDTLPDSVEVNMIGATSEPNLADDDEDLGEDTEESLSDINNSGDASPPHQGDLAPEDETADVFKPYNPSLWTPMEIATATGKPYTTFLEHPLKLRSTYSEVVGSSGTRCSNGEPLVTSYNTCFMGTVDYIWRSEGLCTSKVLAPISKDAMQPSRGFPTKKWGSDHIALASELAFTKNCKE